MESEQVQSCMQNPKLCVFSGNRVDRTPQKCAMRIVSGEVMGPPKALIKCPTWPAVYDFLITLTPELLGLKSVSPYLVINVLVPRSIVKIFELF